MGVSGDRNLLGSIKANADLSTKQYYAVTISSSGADLANAAGEKTVGLLQNAPISGDACEICFHGIAIGILGGTVSVDDWLTTDANGKLVATVEQTDHVIGRALEAGVSNDRITVLVGTAAQASRGSILSIPVVLSKVANGDVVTNYTPGFAGRIAKFSAIVTDPVTTGSKATTLTLEIGATPTTGGSLALTSANCATLGAVINASAITAARDFSASDTLSVVAASTTAFVEGEIVLQIVLK